MTLKRRLIIGYVFGVLLLMCITFFVGVRFGAKLHYFQSSSFSAFKTMRNLNALRTEKAENISIIALIDEKETDLDMELSTVSTYQKSGLYWFGFFLKHTDDTVFLRSIADYREHNPSKPMHTTVLNKEQRQNFLRFYADITKEQELLLEKYRK